MAAYYHVYTAMDMCQVGKTAVSIQYNFIFFLAGSCFVNKYIDPGSLVMSKHPTSPRCVLSKISRNVWIEYYTEIQKRKVMTRQTHRCADWLNKIASSFHYKFFFFVFVSLFCNTAQSFCCASYIEHGLYAMRRCLFIMSLTHLYIKE